MTHWSNKDPGRYGPIACCVIVGRGASPGDFRRMVASVVDKVDGIFVHVNDQECGEWVSLVIDTAMGDVHRCDEALIEFHEWENDFSVARNQNWAMVPEGKYDWIFWLDSDDELVAPEGLEAVIDEFEPGTVGAFLRYDYARLPEQGVAQVEQWRERIFATRRNWHWVYPVHEVVRGQLGTKYARSTEAWVVHNRKPDTGGRVYDRNRKLIAKARKEFPDEPRFDLYFAHEVFVAGMEEKRGSEKAAEMFNAAIKLYDDFMQRLPGTDLAYQAACRQGQCFEALNEHNRAIDSYMRGLKIRPSWPEAYVGIAQACIALGGLDEAEHWCTLLLKAGSSADTTQAVEPMKLRFEPLVLRAEVRLQKSDMAGAMEDIEEAKQIFWSNDLEERFQEIITATTKRDIEETGLVGLRKERWGNSDCLQGSICFFVRPVSESWHPDLEAKQGFGGAETCVMRLAPLFAQAGWRVAVFGNPPAELDETEREGVEWYHASKFDADEPWDVFVGSRIPEVFDASPNAKVKLLWLHDVAVGPNLLESEFGSRLDSVDAFVCLTEWHANHTARLYGIPHEQIRVVPNGVSFVHEAVGLWKPGDEPKFIYSSSPDRGVDVLLGMWDEIRSKHGGELHVTYGFQFIDKLIKLDPRRTYAMAMFKESVMRQVEDLGGYKGGIIWHDRVRKEELHELMSSCSHLLYPGYFMETFCITAIEAQLAGAIPLVSDLAGLKETVHDPELRVAGWPNNVTYRRDYLARLDWLMGLDPEVQAVMQGANRAHARNFTWDNAFMEWNRVINEQLILKGALDVVTSKVHA